MVFLRLGLVVILIRVVLVIVFGNRLPGHTLFTLPHVPLPSWAAGVSIGGPVTAEAVLAAVVQGLRLAVVLVCFGAANSLASPYRLLRCLPAVLYEAGVAITVALSFAPELVMAITDIRAARRLRGRPLRGLAGLRGTAVPVLERALDRSLQLASSMDARGYGRRVAVARRRAPDGDRGDCGRTAPGGGGRLRGPGGGVASRGWHPVRGRRCRAGGGRSGHRRPTDQPDALPTGPVGAARVAGGGLGRRRARLPRRVRRPRRARSRVRAVAAAPARTPGGGRLGILLGLVPAWAAPVERTSPAPRVTARALPAGRCRFR